MYPTTFELCARSRTPSHGRDAQDELRRRMSPVIALTIDGPSDEALEREEFERASAETIALWWKALSRLRQGGARRWRPPRPRARSSSSCSRASRAALLEEAMDAVGAKPAMESARTFARGAAARRVLAARRERRGALVARAALGRARRRAPRGDARGRGAPLTAATARTAAPTRARARRRTSACAIAARRLRGVASLLGALPRDEGGAGRVELGPAPRARASCSCASRGGPASSPPPRGRARREAARRCRRAELAARAPFAGASIRAQPVRRPARATRSTSAASRWRGPRASAARAGEGDAALRDAAAQAAEKLVELRAALARRSGTSAPRRRSRPPRRRASSSSRRPRPRPSRGGRDGRGRGARAAAPRRRPRPPTRACACAAAQHERAAAHELAARRGFQLPEVSDDALLRAARLDVRARAFAAAAAARARAATRPPTRAAAQARVNDALHAVFWDRLALSLTPSPHASAADLVAGAAAHVR